MKNYMFILAWFLTGTFSATAQANTISVKNQYICGVNFKVGPEFSDLGDNGGITIEFSETRGCDSVYTAIICSMNSTEKNCEAKLSETLFSTLGASLIKRLDDECFVDLTMKSHYNGSFLSSIRFRH